MRARRKQPGLPLRSKGSGPQARPHQSKTEKAKTARLEDRDRWDGEKEDASRSKDVAGFVKKNHRGKPSTAMSLWDLRLDNRPEGTSRLNDQAGESQDRGGVWTTGKKGDLRLDHREDAGGGAVDESTALFTYLGNVGVEKSFTWADELAGTAEVGVSGWAGAWGAAPGVRGAYAAPGGETVKGAGFVFGDATYRVRDLGPYDGDDAALEGKRGVQLESYARATVMANLGVLGVGGRLWPSKSRGAIYRTHLDDDAARELLKPGEEGAFERKALDAGLPGAGLARQADKLSAGAEARLKALGLAEKDAPLPDLKDPDSMKVGDEVLLRVSGSVNKSLVVGKMTRGIYQSLTGGEFDLAVRKLDDDKVELAVTPSEIDAVRTSVHATRFLDAREGKIDAAALRQSFTFDLSTESGREAYLAALDGELPGGEVQRTSPDSRDKRPAQVRDGAREDADALPDDVVDLATFLREEELPEGVERSGLERVELESDYRGAGFTWGPIQYGWGLLGLNQVRDQTRESHSVVGKERALQAEQQGSAVTRQRLWSGSEKKGAWATVHEGVDLADPDDPKRGLVSLELSATFSDSAVRGAEADRFVKELNQAFGTARSGFWIEGPRLLGGLRRAGTGAEAEHDRTLSVKRSLSPAELERLAGLDEAGVVQALDEGAGPASDSLVARCQELCRQLAGAADDLERAYAVRGFVAEAGLDGVGALHQLLGGEADALRFESTSELYTEPLVELEQFLFRTAALDDEGEISRGDQAQREREGQALRERLLSAEGFTHDDAFLSDGDRRDLRTRLRAGRAALEEALAELNPG